MEDCQGRGSGSECVGMKRTGMGDGGEGKWAGRAGQAQPGRSSGAAGAVMLAGWVLALAVWAIPGESWGAAGWEAGSPVELGMAPERLARLDAVFAEMVAGEELPGAVVLVARQGRLAHLGVYGERDREAGQPMRADTLFRIASQTKAVVSVGILMLQEEGRLLISDPLGKYLPEFNETTVAEEGPGGSYRVTPAKRKITLRDLLTHTAGIGYGGGPGKAEWAAAGITGWYFAHREEPVGAVVARMAKLPMEGHPGEKYVYGYATDILGVVIEKVSGQTLEAFLQERIFQPLGMKDTHFFVPESKRDRLAVVYNRREGKLERAPDAGTMESQGAYVDGPRQCFSGGAGLVSTARDYATFLQTLLNGGSWGEARLLSPKTVALMASDHLPAGVEFPWTPGMGFGLGFSVLEDLGRRGEPGTVGEFGWGGAYHTTYWIDPAEELVVVYMTQVIPAGGLDDHAKLRALVYAALVEEGGAGKN